MVANRESVQVNAEVPNTSTFTDWFKRKVIRAPKNENNYNNLLGIVFGDKGISNYPVQVQSLAELSQFASGDLSSPEYGNGMNVLKEWFLAGGAAATVFNLQPIYSGIDEKTKIRNVPATHGLSILEVGLYKMDQSQYTSTAEKKYMFRTKHIDATNQDELDILTSPNRIMENYTQSTASEDSSGYTWIPFIVFISADKGEYSNQISYNFKLNNTMYDTSVCEYNLQIYSGNKRNVFKKKITFNPTHINRLGERTYINSQDYDSVGVHVALIPAAYNILVEKYMGISDPKLKYCVDIFGSQVNKKTVSKGPNGEITVIDQPGTQQHSGSAAITRNMAPGFTNADRIDAGISKQLNEIGRRKRVANIEAPKPELGSPPPRGDGGTGNGGTGTGTGGTGNGGTGGSGGGAIVGNPNPNPSGGQNAQVTTATTTTAEIPSMKFINEDIKNTISRIGVIIDPNTIVLTSNEMIYLKYGSNGKYIGSNSKDRLISNVLTGTGDIRDQDGEIISDTGFYQTAHRELTPFTLVIDDGLEVPPGNEYNGEFTNQHLMEMCSLNTLRAKHSNSKDLETPSCLVIIQNRGKTRSEILKIAEMLSIRDRFVMMTMGHTKRIYNGQKGIFPSNLDLVRKIALCDKANNGPWYLPRGTSSLAGAQGGYIEGEAIPTQLITMEDREKLSLKGICTYKVDRGKLYVEGIHTTTDDREHAYCIASIVRSVIEIEKHIEGIIAKQDGNIILSVKERKDQIRQETEKYLSLIPVINISDPSFSMVLDSTATENKNGVTQLEIDLPFIVDSVVFVLKVGVGFSGEDE